MGSSNFKKAQERDKQYNLFYRQKVCVIQKLLTL